MPEATFTLRWPDDRVTDGWSPSLVVHDHLEVGMTYSVGELVARTDAALQEASERVRLRYGFACTASAASAEQVRRTAAGYDPGARVEVLAVRPPLPVPPTPVPGGPR